MSSRLVGEGAPKGRMRGVGRSAALQERRRLSVRRTPSSAVSALRADPFSHKGRRDRRLAPFLPIAARSRHMPHQSVPARRRAFARTLRREATEAEDRLWQELRGRRLDGIKFRRQVPVGRFVADFLCSDAMLIVEVDGSQHAGSMRDDKRTAELNRLGFRVLRFWNDASSVTCAASAPPSSPMSGIPACSPGAEAGSQTFSSSKDRPKGPFSPCRRRWIGAQRRDG